MTVAEEKISGGVVSDNGVNHQLFVGLPKFVITLVLIGLTGPRVSDISSS